MAKAELGTKRVCPETGRKFYDLNKNPVISPYTGKVVPIETPAARARPEPAPPPASTARPVAAAAPPPAEEVVTTEPQEAETVSLEEADAEAAGAKGPVETAEPDIEEEVEMDETLDDATFIEEQEEEDADVTDIIGGDIENEEEG
ncbi:MAG: TIGR02300 family protein [Hyphomicrobiales bacterium]|nr:TIGR02300 family protein [Hyphomicrobiales bacterium]MDE1974406.1 TIGR02300 family protein [Hyphomicrobiales bacterium]MDE2285561.1 TIGR02300 family protein [Hyphomicrobiales bacterium]MDE2372687.1 TIGR02300 family protein [Hyphomicrobiales bacterium]